MTIGRSYPQLADVEKHLRPFIARLNAGGIDRTYGTIVASHQLRAAARTLAVPGSVLKPLFLYRSIETGQWAFSGRVVCNRKLVIETSNCIDFFPECRTCMAPPQPSPLKVAVAIALAIRSRSFAASSRFEMICFEFLRHKH